MNYFEEAAGITLAAKRAGMPVAVSFTVETDGKLPTGETLRSAIERLDKLTGNAPAYYMINCAHPEHFNERGSKKVHGSSAYAASAPMPRPRATPNSMSSTELDIGDIAGLADHYRDLQRRLPQARRHRRLLRYRSPPYRGDLESLPRGLEKASALRCFCDIPLVGRSKLAGANFGWGSWEAPPFPSSGASH